MTDADVFQNVGQDAPKLGTPDSGAQALRFEDVGFTSAATAWAQEPLRCFRIGASHLNCSHWLFEMCSPV